MTVYIEYVIIDNLVIDYLMLKATFALTGLDFKRGRLFLCAFLGAMVALIYPLIEIAIISTLIKILSGFLITLLATNYRSKKEYFIVTALFFCYTFLTGGAIMGVYSVLGIDYSSEYSIALMVLPVYLILRIVSSVIKFIYRRRHVVSATFNVTLCVGENKVSGKGFFDTGNALYDGDSPVIVCGKRFAKNLIGKDFYKVKMKKIKVNTVSGGTENIAFRLDELVIYIWDEPNIFNNVTLCVAGVGVGEGYDVILHPALMEEIYDNKRIFKTQKVS
ncbi:MAG: sigma-E processing peptidase SpoIIGA [Clostridia bacterium]|nr:sigma-E processing peptidase SpoIIGA [Clostridia bacterium]